MRNYQDTSQILTSKHNIKHKNISFEVKLVALPSLTFEIPFPMISIDKIYADTSCSYASQVPLYDPQFEMQNRKLALDLTYMFLHLNVQL